MDLSRVEMLVGAEALEKIKNAKVCVIGLGGVGAYAAEALVRSGIGTMRIIDGDVVEASNINRQLPALHSTIGKSKVDVMAARFRDINPECKLETLNAFYKAGDFADFFDSSFDYVVDAIDDVQAKVDILASCYKAGIPVISAMGTGNKLNPEKLQVTDISKTHTCPLAKHVRHDLRAMGITKGIDVVFSTEEPVKVFKGPTPASMVFVPGSAGLLMASWIVRKIVLQCNTRVLG